MSSSRARQRALKSGATTYYGKPCRRCHRTKRYTSNGACCRCVVAVVRAIREFPNYSEGSP